MFPSALGRADHGSVLPQTDRSVNRGRHSKEHPGSGVRNRAGSPLFQPFRCMVTLTPRTRRSHESVIAGHRCGVPGRRTPLG